MRRTRLPLWLVFMLAFTVLGAGTPTSGSTSEIRADLEGKPIDVEDIPRYSCHDLDFPLIHCFKTHGAAQRDVEKKSVERFGVAALGTLGVTYVIAYDNAWFAAPSLFVSQAYTDLGQIGWNDRISSYKSVNNGSGHFARDIYDSGLITYFCCNTQVGWVGSLQNDSYTGVFPY